MLTPRKKGLDRDLKRLNRIEQATLAARKPMGSITLGLLFLLAVFVFAIFQAGDAQYSAFIVAGGVIGGYMALNIGANDVANNVGPAVGSRALTMAGALVIAAIFEASGAILAGGDVVSTISKSIVDPSSFNGPRVFIIAMTSALLAAALWINVATYVGAPVSTTHSIVGGVLGAGLAAAGVAAVSWITMSKIAASWVISPVLGGLIAASFYAVLEMTVLNKDDKIAAARKWIPAFVAVMVAAFTAYMMMKGLKRIWKPDSTLVIIVSILAFGATVAAVRPFITKASVGLENRRKAVSDLFTIPLICSAAFLSFGHGANDVANAVGPLAAIVSAVGSGEVAAKVEIPVWVMIVGAIGISAGLVLFGPKLVRTVGTKITKLDRSRAFCVALSAAVTVITASTLGLPVSSTHIAVGGVFGVGFYREYRANRRGRRRDSGEELGSGEAPGSGETMGPGDVLAKSVEQADHLRSPLEEKLHPAGAESESPEKTLKAERRKLVRRQHFLTIIAAWLITVPFSAALAATVFFILTSVL